MGGISEDLAFGGSPPSLAGSIAAPNAGDGKLDGWGFCNPASRLTNCSVESNAIAALPADNACCKPVANSISPRPGKGISTAASPKAFAVLPAVNACCNPATLVSLNSTDRDKPLSGPSGAPELPAVAVSVTPPVPGGLARNFCSTSVSFWDAGNTGVSVL